MPSTDHPLPHTGTETRPDDLDPAPDAPAADGVQPLFMGRPLVIPRRGHTRQPRLIKHRTLW